MFQIVFSEKKNGESIAAVVCAVTAEKAIERLLRFAPNAAIFSVRKITR